MSDTVNCPRCGEPTSFMTLPDYGQGAEFVCHGARCGAPYGWRFLLSGPAAQRLSAESRAMSRANAEAYRRGR